MTGQINSSSINNLLANLSEFNPGNIQYDVLSLDNVAFGGTTDSLKLSSSTYDLITSLTLRVSLPVISTVNRSTGGKGYISWINNIGHSIIDGIELKLDTYTIYDLGFPYDKFLDIYNEINDTNKKEYSGIGKYNSSIELDKYQTNVINLDIPLHLWFSQDINSALPLFMLDSRELQFKVKLKSFAGLHYYNPVGNSGNITTVTPTANLVVGYFKLNDITLKTKLKKQNYSHFFNYYTNTTKSTMATTNSISSNESLPLKEILFVAINQTRDSSNSGTGPYKINKLITDINKNDYFNYGNIAIESGNGDYDTFKTMNIKFDNDKYYNSDLNAEFIRTTTISDNHNNVPNIKSGKFIYCLPFTPSPNHNNIKGALDFQDIDTISLDFSSIPSNYKLYVFFNHIKKISIKNGKATFDNWTTTDKAVTQTAFKDTTEEIKTIELDTVITKTSQEKLSQMVYNILPSSSFLITDYKIVNESITIDFVIGNDLNNQDIINIQAHSDEGSIQLKNTNYIFSLENITEQKQMMKIPEKTRNIIWELIERKYDEGIMDLEELMGDILPYSDGLFVKIYSSQPKQLSHWLNNDDIIKETTKVFVKNVIDHLYVYNPEFNTNLFTATFDHIVRIDNGKYTLVSNPQNIIDALDVLFSGVPVNGQDTELPSLKWTNKKAEIPYIIIIPTKYNPIHEIDDKEYTKSIVEQFGIVIPIDTNKTITHQSLLQTITNIYSSRLQLWLDKTIASKNTDPYTSNLARLKDMSKYSKTISNLLSPVNNKNFYSIYKVVNVKLTIPGDYHTTITNANDKLNTVDLESMTIGVTDIPTLTFNFMNVL
jgi:hypothetical protein